MEVQSLRFLNLKASTWFILGFMLLMFTLQNINGRFWLNDFKVMYMAAEAFMDGEQVYGQPFGLSTGYFKYSPVSLLFFTPYLALDYYWASVLHFSLIGLVFFAIFDLLNKWGMPLIQEKFQSGKKEFWFFLAFFIVVVVHLSRELHLGNVNIFLIFLFLLGFKAYMKEQTFLAGFYFALIVLTKPYWILLALPFVFSKAWKLLGFSILNGLLLILISFLISGFSETWTLYQEWIDAMLAHSSYLTSAHTWFGILEAWFNVQGLGSLSIYVFVLVSLILTLVFFFKTEVSNKANQLLVASLILAMTPNFLITDTEHFLYSIPVLVFLLSRFATLSLSLKIVTLLGFIGYAFNPVPDFGTLGLGNFLLLFVFFILWMQEYQVKKVKPGCD